MNCQNEKVSRTWLQYFYFVHTFLKRCFCIRGSIIPNSRKKPVFRVFIAPIQTRNLSQIENNALLIETRFLNIIGP